MTTTFPRTGGGGATEELAVIASTFKTFTQQNFGYRIPNVPDNAMNSINGLILDRTFCF